MSADINLGDYLNVAKQVAWRIWKECRGHHDLDELESEALLALVQARDKYDPSRGCSFRTFAATKVYFFVHDWLRRDAFLPRGEMQKVKRGERAPVKFHSIHATPPSAQDAKDTYGAILEAEDERGRIVLRDEVAVLFRQLEPIDRDMLRLYYLDGLTMKQVGQALEISESRVSQRIAAVRLRFGGLVAIEETREPICPPKRRIRVAPSILELLDVSRYQPADLVELRQEIERTERTIAKTERRLNLLRMLEVEIAAVVEPAPAAVDAAALAEVAPSVAPEPAAPAPMNAAAHLNGQKTIAELATPPRICGVPKAQRPSLPPPIASEPAAEEDEDEDSEPASGQASPQKLAAARALLKGPMKVADLAQRSGASAVSIYKWCQAEFAWFRKTPTGDVHLTTEGRESVTGKRTVP